MNSLIQRIIHQRKERKKGNMMNKSGLVISLRNIHLRQLSDRTNLNAAICVWQGDVKYYIEKIPLKNSPDAESVWLDFTGREKELTAGEWVVREIEISETEEVIYRYEVCRSITVEWEGNNYYDWTVDNDWGGLGNGSKKQPYEVCSPRTLDRVRNYVNKENIYFRQMCDIQLTGALKINYSKAARLFISQPDGFLGDEKGWLPIGLYTDKKEDASFQGEYDGKGFKIDGLFINRPNCDVQGLFGIVEGASKRSPAYLLNIHIGDTSAITGQSYLGGVVGNAGYAVIHDCTNYGQINGIKNVGGIAGATIHTDIADCCNFGYITGVRDWNEVVGRDAGSGMRK
ncbi:MAG: hypothetical protein RSC80_00410 [Odoribacter sp.]